MRGKVRYDFEERGEHKLDVLSYRPPIIRYAAKAPGQAHIDVQVIDRKTLLSPPLGVVIDVVGDAPPR